jgi:hypothetical protein
VCIVVVHVRADPVDRDQDGDVDGVDFAVFASCFNGAGKPPRSTGCSTEDAAAFDSDDDGDIDGVDFSEFATCFNGAGNPPRCIDVFVVSNEAELLAAANTQARCGDIIEIVAGSIITSNQAVHPRAGVRVTTTGTPADTAIHADIDYSSVPNRAIRPDSLMIENLTIGGVVKIYDASDVVIRNCVIDGTADGGALSNSDGVSLFAYEDAEGSLLLDQCVVKNVGWDGVSLKVQGGGTVANASGYTLTIRDCTVAENIGYGSGNQDTHQAATTHSLGRLEIDGGSYAGHPTAPSIAAGNPVDPILVENATCTGAGFSASAVKGSTLNCLGSGFSMTANASVIAEISDSEFLNYGMGNLYGDWKILRCRFENAPFGHTIHGLTLRTTDSSIEIESSVFIGQKTSTVSVGVGAFGDDWPKRKIVMTNCVFHDYKVVFDLPWSHVQQITSRNGVFLGNDAIKGAFPFLFWGGNNYRDMPADSSGNIMATDVHFPNGDGADAYLMVDYDNDNFRPVGPGNFVKGLGLEHLNPVYDRDGKLFDQQMPDVGAFKAD